MKNTKNSIYQNFSFIDVCAGVGGFRQSFNSFNGECVMTCEIDKFCKKTYLDNYIENHWEDDVTSIDINNIKSFDILCAGFPCQAFSLGGKQEGFLDEKGRGTIFFNIADIAVAKRPKLMFFENVKNLLTHDKSRTFKIIQEKIDEMGYHHHYFIINAQHYVPQRRERIYIICADKNVFSFSEFNQIVENINNDYEKQKQQPLPKISEILEKEVDPKYTISDKLWAFLQQHANKHKSKGNGFGYGLVDPEKDTNTRTLTARYYKDGSEILIAQKNKNPRKLTPREAARLMGFPEDFKQTSSDTQSYKQMGNSVVIPVVKLFAKNLSLALKNKL